MLFSIFDSERSVEAVDSPDLGWPLKSIRGTWPSDDIEEHPDERQEENDEEPDGLGQAAVILASEVVEERPNNHEDQEEETRGEDQGPEHAE
jgi:hypothetical protein